MFPVIAITVGHRTKSEHFSHVTGHVYCCLDTMSGQACGDAEAAKKCSVLKTTVEKWITENDRALNTSIWLKYDQDPSDRTRTIALKCSVCTMFENKLIG